MSSKRSISAGQAVASPRWAASTSAAQRSRSSTSVITREEPAPVQLHGSSGGAATGASERGHICHPRSACSGT